MKTNDIMFLRLKNKDDVVGELQDTSDTHITLKTPIQIVYYMSPTGGISISYREWIFSSMVQNVSEVRFPRSELLFIGYVTDKMLKVYEKAVESILNEPEEGDEYFNFSGNDDPEIQLELEQDPEEDYEEFLEQMEDLGNKSKRTLN